MAFRFRRRPSVFYAAYSSRSQPGCGCCGCLLAPFLIWLLLFLNCLRWLAKKLLTRL